MSRFLELKAVGAILHGLQTPRSPEVRSSFAVGAPQALGEVPWLLLLQTYLKPIASA